MDKKEVAAFLRRRREMLRPRDVGLVEGPRRRTQGLRREEVAQLAGMSTDYYARLEQQRAPQPSVQITTALARALRLTLDERDHLFVLIGHNAPARFHRSEHVSPTLMRVLDRLDDSPALVKTDLVDTLAMNPLAIALLGDQTLPHSQLRSSGGTPIPASPTVDTRSTVFTTAGLGALVYAIIEAPERGWGDPLVLGMFAGSAVLLTGLVLRSRGVERPMLDMTLLAHRGFLLNTVAATLVMFVMSGLMFVLPSYLQSVLGNDTLGTGVRMLPMILGLSVAAKLAPPVTTRFGARATVTAGLVVLAFATLLGSRTTAGSGYGFTVLWLSIAGLGFGFAFVPAMTGALSTLPRDRAGSGSGLLMTLRQVGAAIGIALLGSLLSDVFRDRLDVTGLPARAADTAGDSVVAAHLVAQRTGSAELAASANSAYVHGMGVVLLVCAVAALVSALLAAAFLPGTRAAGKTAGTPDTPDLVPAEADAGQ